MIVGIGTDLINGERLGRAIERHGEKIIARLFTSHERERAQQKVTPIPTFTRIFAAKEAVLKALGTGMAEGLGWQDIEIYRAGNTPPEVHLSGAALARFQALIPAQKKGHIHLSVSDDWPHAVAFVVLSVNSYNP